MLTWLAEKLPNPSPYWLWSTRVLKLERIWGPLKASSKARGDVLMVFIGDMDYGAVTGVASIASPDLETHLCLQ